MIAIGWTSSRHGLRPGVLDLVAARLVEISMVSGELLEIHHGDCVGGDAEMHELCRRMMVVEKIVVHPPINPAMRAYCDGPNVTILPPKEYIPRNHDIVDQSLALWAAPWEFQPQPRGGTWGTIRYARAKGKAVENFTNRIPNMEKRKCNGYSG